MMTDEELMDYGREIMIRVCGDASGVVDDEARARLLTIACDLLAMALAGVDHRTRVAAMAKIVRYVAEWTDAFDKRDKQ